MDSPSSSTGHTSDEGSDTESSSSLQRLAGSPDYSELAPSDPSDDEDMVGDVNLAPVHVHGNQGDHKGEHPPETATVVNKGADAHLSEQLLRNHEGTSGTTSTEAQWQDYGRRIDSIDAKIDQLFHMIANLATSESQPINTPQQFVDPQLTELEAMVQSHRSPHATAGFTAAQPIGGIHINEPVMADHSASAAPMPGALRDYHDIAENIIDRKMKKIAEEHAPRNLESELEKPYEAWHDKVAFPAGWHPPKFRQFDGNGDAREHLVYFEAACGDTANTPSLLLRQFSASLKGPAFHWYSRLPAGSVRSWQTMKDLFKSHFISMSKDTSLLELSQIKQEVSRREPKTFSALGNAVAATKLEFEKAPHIMELYKNAGTPDYAKKFNSTAKPFNNGVKPKLRDEPEASTCNVSCNMVTSNGDTDDSEGEIVFTEHERKALGTDAISEENKREVNMNLRGGKDLAEPIRSRQYRLEKEKPIVNRDATISKVQQEKSKEEEAKDHDVEYNIIAHLKRIPALLSVYDALVLLPELREALIKALKKPESYQTAMAKHRLLDNLLYANQITFSEEDQMLDHGDHNRPLYIEGNVGAAHLQRILIDPGSAVNILPMRSLTRAGYILEDLGATEVVICGYDNHAKPALGVITLRLQMASYSFKVKFFVIEANASYSALLGRPWIHKYRVVPSTLHQCLKFMDKNGEQQCISGNTSPYTIQEVHHADAKYYFPSIEPGKQQGRSTPNVDVLTTPSTTSVTPSTTEMKFLIAPCSSSPGPSIGKLAVQNDKQEKLGIEGSMNNHVGKGLSTTAPILLRADNASTSTSPLSTGTTGGCTLSAAAPILIKAHPSKDCAAKPEKESLGIMPRILSESLLMQPPSLYISVTTPLDVLAVQSANKRAIPTIFYKVPEKQPCDDVYRLPNEGFEIEEALTTMKVEDRMIPLLRRAGILIQPNSRLPSPPVVCEEWWEQAEKLIKKGSNFHPKYGLGYHEEDSSDEEEGLHVTHGFNSLAHGEVLDAAPAPPELEDGVELTVDELTEINLGTEDDPRPTYVSATLTNEEREEYKMFLMQYRDCFAWSYKEMPGLDPQVATHKLAIDPQFRPVKQLPRRFRPELQDQIIAEVDKLIAAGFIKEVNHVPRGENAPADALAKLASALTFLDSQSVQVRVEERWLLPAVLEVVQEEREMIPWKGDNCCVEPPPIF
ncbi:hypothetical protein ACQ4PT_049321 [Festuca glaucescens]